MTFAIVMTFLTVAFFALYAGNAVFKARRNTTSRLAVYGAGPPDLREQTLAQPLSERFVGPVLLGLGRVVRRFTPEGWLRKTDQRLVLGGNPGNLDANSWAVIKLLSGGGALVLWIGFQAFLDSGGMRFLSLILLIVAGFFGPDAWLNQRVESRRESMRRQLPDILDLLVISVEAGLGFDAALTRVVDTVPGPMSEEFFRMLQETRVGVSRREAMKHLQDRTDVEELRSFLLAMMQAEAFGVAIARVLRVQAEEMRVKRRQRAQEKAFAAPVKLVFPLVLCIFPPLFVVLLGPAAVQVYRALTNL